MGIYDSKPITEKLDEMPTFNVRLKQCTKKITTDNSKVEKIEHSSIFGINYKTSNTIKVESKVIEQKLLKIDYDSLSPEMDLAMNNLLEEFKKKYNVKYIIYRISNKIIPPSDFTQLVSITPKYITKYNSDFAHIYCS